MNYRNAKILPEKTLTDTGTETIDINIKDIISRITLAFRRVKTYQYMADHGYADIIKIELVDGSDVLHSLNGGENQALCIYDRHCGSMNNGEHMTTVDEYDLFGIDFGRFLYDPLLAFDPAKFNNPQLKITYDVNLSDTGVTSGYLEIWADCFDEKVVSPVGFLMSKEHWSGAKPTAGYEYIDLPTDYPLRKMLVRAYVKTTEPWYNIGSVRLDEDNEKRIPFDWTDMEDYTRVMRSIWTPVEELLATQVQNTSAVWYVTPTDYFFAVAGIEAGGASGIYLNDTSMKGGKLTLAAATNRQIHAIVRGFLPNHCFEFPFGDQMDIADWYDVTKLGSLRLRLGAGTGGAVTAGVVLQQLRRY
jgi:hypothetical protein